MTGAWTAINAFVLDQLYSFQDVNELTKNIIALASSRGGNHELGGSRLHGVASSAFVAVPDYRAPAIVGAGLAGLTARAVVEYRTSDTGTAVDWQIVDLDDSNTVVAAGTAYSASTNWQREAVAVTLHSGDHRYQLQVKGANDSAEVFALGRMELYATA